MHRRKVSLQKRQLDQHLLATIRAIVLGTLKTVIKMMIDVVVAMVIDAMSHVMSLETRNVTK